MEVDFVLMQKDEPMDDLISRHMAIDSLRNINAIARPISISDDVLLIDKAEAMTELMMLSSSQPEIIYCGDCKYKDDGIDEDGIPFLKCLHGRSYGGTRINDFCSWAERRIDG